MHFLLDIFCLICYIFKCNNKQITKKEVININNYNNLKMRTWAEIDLNSVKENYLAQRALYDGKAKVCCVVKANAYGHGAVRMAKLFEELGADFYAVATIDEAIDLRDAGIFAPVLVLGYTPPENARILAEKRISQCIPSYEYAEMLSEIARREGVKIPVHFKIDTGMGRLGFVFRHSSDESVSELLKACSFDCFIHEGIFTHFPVSDYNGAGIEYTKAQYDRFLEVISLLEDNGYSFEVRHCSNSAAALYDPQYALDMVRVGLLFFGALPSDERESDFIPKQTMTLKTVIANIKSVKAGDSVGYGREYIAKKDMKVATVPIGYADGFIRTNYPNGIKLSVGGYACPIVGRVCMDQSMIDVSDVEEIKIGDEVIVFGNGGCNSLFDFAKKNGTIPNEILCLVGARVPRIYK